MMINFCLQGQQPNPLRNSSSVGMLAQQQLNARMQADNFNNNIHLTKVMKTTSTDQLEHALVQSQCQGRSRAARFSSAINNAFKKRSSSSK